MIIKNEFPILERSTESHAVINPQASGETFPRLCVIAFFEEAIAAVIQKHESRKIGTYPSEMKEFNVYQLKYYGTELCVIQAVVASGSIAMMVDWLYGKGVEIILCCGGCGVLDDIPAGDVILPVRALRDEGASNKYLAASRFIELQAGPIKAIKKVLEQYKIRYIECTTWSTDGFYRETREMIEYRKAEGCRVVEMECATMAAVAQYRNKGFGQVLYSGDMLSGSEPYDDRGWYCNFSAREKLLWIAMEALRLL